MPPAPGAERGRPRRLVVVLGRPVEDVVQAVGGGARALGAAGDAGQRRQRHGDQRQRVEVGDERARRQPAGDDAVQPPAEHAEADQPGGERGAAPRQRLEGGGAHRRVARAFEPPRGERRLVRLAAERLDDAQAAERLADARQRRRGGFERLAVQAAQPRAEGAVRQRHDERERGQRGGEPPVHRAQQHGAAEHHGGVAGGAHHVLGHGAAQLVAVGGQARRQLADAQLVEARHRQRQRMRDDAAAQLGDDAVAEPLREHVAQQLQHGGGEPGRGRHEQQPGGVGRVAAGPAAVERRAGQRRHGERGGGGEQRRGERRAGQPPVRAEQARQARRRGALAHQAARNTRSGQLRASASAGAASRPSSACATGLHT